MPAFKPGDRIRIKNHSFFEGLYGVVQKLNGTSYEVILHTEPFRIKKDHVYRALVPEHMMEHAVNCPEYVDQTDTYSAQLYDSMVSATFSTEDEEPEDRTFWDFETLINIAIDTNDQEWFTQLVEQQKQIGGE